jgi:PAS domain S-box-containing protein
MSQFDPRSVVATFTVFWLVLSAIATAVWWTRRRYRGFGKWAAAGPTLTLSLLLMGLRPAAPEWVSMVWANAMLIVASTLYLEGAREFQGLPPRRWSVYACGVATIGVLTFFLYVVPNLNARAFIISTDVGGVLLLTSLTLLRRIPASHKLGLRLTGTLFFLCAVTYLARAVYCIFGPPLGDVFAASGFNRAFFLLSSALMAIFPVGFIFLVDEKAIAEVQEANAQVMQERQFRTLADAAPVMIWMAGLDKGCTYFNRLWLEFTGRPLEAEIGDGWTEGVHPDDHERCLDTYARAFDRRQPFRMEYRLRRYDGAYRWVVDSGVPIGVLDSAFAGYVGSAVDITDYRAAEEALSSLSRKLMTAQEEERTRIARELHDDLAQRATALAIQLHNIVRELPAGTSEHLHVQQTSEQAADLAHGIQVIAHDLHSAKLEILGLAPAAAALCREFEEQYDVAIEFIHESVPAHLPTDVALCLFRVLQESLHNAIRHSGVQDFEVSLHGSPAEVRLEVADRGAGFDPEVPGRNRGLGLISMKERLTLVRGEIQITSRVGAGTTVGVRVPLDAAALVTTYGERVTDDLS